MAAPVACEGGAKPTRATSATPAPVAAEHQMRLARPPAAREARSAAPTIVSAQGRLAVTRVSATVTAVR
jgi:hypothetical protein